jgi:hypothetical protein
MARVPWHRGLPILFGAVLFLSLWLHAGAGWALVNLGFIQAMRTVRLFPERARFEMTEIGVPNFGATVTVPPGAAAQLADSTQLFGLAMAMPASRRAASWGQLRAAALGGAGLQLQLVALGQEQQLPWELASLALNASDDEAASRFIRAACGPPPRCLDVAQRLVNAGRYSAATVLVRDLLREPGLAPADAQATYSFGLEIMPLPGLVHADIVRNCAAFFAREAGAPAWPLAHDAALADIRALCAEGLLVDPGAAAHSDLGPALQYAELAVEQGGPTRYRLLVEGWALLEMGRPVEAETQLRAALAAPSGSYQRGRPDAELTAHIQQLLTRAARANGH